MKNKIQLAVLFAAALALGGCGPCIYKMTEFKSAPAYTGDIEVRKFPHASLGTLLFEMDVWNGNVGQVGIPSGKILEEVKTEAKKRGANVLVFDPARPGTMNAGHVIVDGYLERRPY